MKRLSSTVLIFILALFWLFPFSAVAEEQNNNITDMEEIVVTGSNEAEMFTPVSPLNNKYGAQYNIITDEQIKEQNSKDFKDTLRNVPGVMFQSKNLMGDQTGASLYIRGRGASHPSSDLAILFDGVPRYGALYGQILADGIAVSTIDSVELFKGPQPSQFGSGYASINIRPKYLSEDGKELNLSISGGSYGTFIESISGGIKEGNFDFYMSQSWGSTDGSSDHSRAQQQNYYFNAGYKLNDNWNIRLLTNYVDGQTNAPRPDPTPPALGVSWPAAERFDTESFLTTLTLNHQYENSEGYIKAYWNDTSFDLLQELVNGQRYAGGSGGLWSRQDISLYGVRAKEKLYLWKGGEIIAGVDLDMTRLKNTQRTYSGQAHPGINGGYAVRTWDFPDMTLFSPYLAISQEFKISDKLNVTPSAGFRYYHHDEFTSKSSPQAGLVIGYGNTDLNFSYAKGVNYPSPVILQNMVLDSNPVTNPSQYWKDIKPEVVDHFEVGLTHTLPGIATLGATAFHDKGKDRVQAYMYGGIPSQFNDTIGSYKIRGIELSATVKPTQDLEIFAGATWLKAEATGSDGIEQDKMPYTPNFALQAGFSWRFMDNFKLYMDIQHFNGVYQGTNSRAGNFDFRSLTDADKLDDITVVNARLGYTFDYHPWGLKESEIFLAVNNILNKDYEYAKGYRMPGTTFFVGFNFKFK